MNQTDIGVGSVVLSKQGRDKGSYFLVVAVGDGVVYLCDGGMRKLAAPKKKNVKHVSNSGVRLTNNHEVKAYVSGKLRIHSIRILPGDAVKLEMSPYDLTKGRIVWRQKGTAMPPQQ